MPSTLTPAPPAYAWISAEDVVRHALAAYYAMSRYADAVETTWGEPMPDGTFAEDLGEVIKLRILKAAHDKFALPELEYVEKYLEGYLTPGKPEDSEESLSNRDIKQVIHCRASHNGNSR